MRQQEIELLHFQSVSTKPNTVEMVEATAGEYLLPYFAWIFSFFTYEKMKMLLMESTPGLPFPLQILVFPVVAVVEFIDAAAANIRLLWARNRNLGKLLNAYAKTQKAAIVIGAVTKGLLLTLAGATAIAAIPELFVTALGMHSLFQFALFVRAVHKYRGLSDDDKKSALGTTYKNKMVQYGISSGVMFTITGAVTGLFLLPMFVAAVANPIGLAVLGTLGVVTALSAFAFTRYMKNRHARQTARYDKERTQQLIGVGASSTKLSGSAKKSDMHTESFQEKQIGESKVQQATVALGAKDTKDNRANDYEYVRNLANVLDQSRSRQELVQAFLNIIDEKIFNLLRQKASAVGPETWFQSIGFDENSKRQHKIEGLQELRKLIIENLNSPKNPSAGWLTKQAIGNIVKKHPRIFQSFFKNKGDVENIFDAAKLYLVGNLDKIFAKLVLERSYGDNRPNI